MTETIEYDVARTVGGVEIRDYPRVVLATVRDLSDNDAFSVLFDFITGHNSKRDRLAMTTPVFSSERPGQDIPMTTPVISGGSTFSFAMPKDFTAQSLPLPIDPRVQVEEIHARTVAVLRFKGRADRRTVERRQAQLLKVLEEQGMETRGEPFLMRYNPPFIPGFLRRNEIGIEIRRPAMSDG